MRTSADGMGRHIDDVNRARIHYGRGLECAVCGKPTDGISLKCEACLRESYYREELAYADSWLKAHPDAVIELAHDKKKRVHLVLFRLPQVAWCGAHVTEQRTKRRSVLSLALSGPITTPAGALVTVCAGCMGIYEQATL